MSADPAANREPAGQPGQTTAGGTGEVAAGDRLLWAWTVLVGASTLLVVGVRQV